MLFGLFKKEPKDSPKKIISQKKKELKKLVKDKQYQKALRIGKEILIKVPHEEDVLFIVGGIYFMQNKYKTAISYLEKALDIGQYDTEALLLKANSHFKLGEKRKAQDCCVKVKEVDPKNKAVAELLKKIQDS